VSAITPRLVAQLALAAAIVTVAYIVFFTGGNSYLVYADLQDAGGLLVHSTVKVAGIPAGEVTSIRITKNYTAVATLALDSNAVPIGAGASVAIRPSDLLGEHYAALSPGDLTRPLPSGSTIPLSRTSDPVELDDVLNMLNPDTSTRLGILINEAGVAMLGHGADMNKLLATMPPTLSQANALLQEVAAENTQLQSMIRQGSQVTVSIDSRHDQLARLVTQASRALSVIADRRAQLDSTLVAAPAGMAALTTTLQRLNDAAIGLRPTAADVERLAPPLTSALRELPGFANAAQGTLREATTVSPSLTRLGAAGTAPVAGLRAPATTLTSVLYQAVRPLDEINYRAMKDLLWFVQNWALGLKARDELGHVVGAKVTIDPSILTTTLSALLGPKTPAVLTLRRHATAHPPTPAKAAAPSAAPAPASKPAAGLTAPVTGLLNKVGSTVTATLGGVQSTLHNIGGKLATGLAGLLGHTAPPAVPAPSPSGQTGSSGTGLSSLLKYLVGR
jgi:virulence factor Mce-like protein